MLINKASLSRMLQNVADLWKLRTDSLCEIDSRFGDGDHGVTIGKMAALIHVQVDEWNDESIREFIDHLGTKIMAISGGSAGPLYGTLVSGMADAINSETIIDGPLLKRMLSASLKSMYDITKARVGDKTMMDSLIPAVDAANAASDDIDDILAAAAKAAADGAEATSGFVSKFGRARSYGEQTIGTPDAGAISTSLLFQGLYEGLK